MLEYISLNQVGPASSMRLDFSPRLNILTGDNGLGKTLFLDIAWWVLTEWWPHLQARPNGDSDGIPSIEFLMNHSDVKKKPLVSSYDFSNQTWRKMPFNAPRYEGLTIYVEVDGGFSIWDSSRNIVRTSDGNIVTSSDGGHVIVGRTAPIQFTQSDVWDGLEKNGHTLCNGLIRDWVSWQHQNSIEFERLCSALKGLSPHENEIITPGDPTRVDITDVRDIPTINLPYGNVPVVHASAGMKRVIALAYLLIWLFSEHKKAAKLTKRQPLNRLVLLMDDVEAHLHPQWQRVLLPSLLQVIKTLEPEIEVQIIASSHAPLVLASLETEFNEEKDRIVNFELSDNEVQVHHVPWTKQGDVTNWLVSDAFGLLSARSREAERAIQAANAYMRGDTGELPEGLNTKARIHQELLRVLPGHDAFWPRWIVRTEVDPL